MKKEESDIRLVFKEYIENSTGRKLTSWPGLYEILQLRQYRKNEYIVRESQQFIFEIFVVHGVFRTFLKGTNGEEINTAFYNGPDIVAPYFTRNINHKHLVNFQALTPCTLLLMEADKFNTLIRNRTDIKEFANRVVENELQFKTTKEVYFSSKTASERLQFFREKYPGLENRIPLHHIASFLGITLVSLSRLRGKM